MALGRNPGGSMESAGMQGKERLPSSLGETIRQIRMSRTLTLEQLAEAAGLTKQAVRRIETGAVVNASIGSLVGIAEALGMRAGILLFLAERGMRKDPNLIGRDVEAQLPELWYQVTGGVSSKSYG